MLIVAHTEEDEGNRIRIISARELTAGERKAYEEGEFEKYGKRPAPRVRFDVITEGWGAWQVRRTLSSSCQSGAIGSRRGAGLSH